MRTFGVELAADLACGCNEGWRGAAAWGALAEEGSAGLALGAGGTGAGAGVGVGAGGFALGVS